MGVLGVTSGLGLGLGWGLLRERIGVAMLIISERDFNRDHGLVSDVGSVLWVMGQGGGGGGGGGGEDGVC